MERDDLPLDNVLRQGLGMLTDLLGSAWVITPIAGSMAGSGPDALVEVRSETDNTLVQLLVEVKDSVPPRMVEELLVPKVELLRRLSHYTNLVVMAPWLSPKTQQLLKQHGIGYLDLTGNISLRVARPAIVVQTDGATRSPRALAPSQSKTTLAGPKASRLIRLLADVRPPHRAGELATASSLSLAYVSRLLDALEDQLLIRRTGRVITEVDWPDLLRARAEHSSLLRPNSYAGFLAPNGTSAVLRRISDLPPAGSDGVAVTGTWAAHGIAPIVAGGQLMLYVAPWLDSEELADDLGLLSVHENADVLLLKAPDPVVFDGATVVEGIQRVAMSQLVLDCLSGPGRLPAAGEAVLEYMATHEKQWRALNISDLGNRQRP
ncbi:hypothetical protein [Kitasatospora sp. NPDC056800]|uniref:hypothetical protein n=1 Tax=Kitasatospora sp. NPDC056800 TaxID=3345948 RepID=UPI0036CA8871